MKIQLIKKDDEYCVRYKGKIIPVWWYVGYDGNWLWPDYCSWHTKAKAEEIMANMIWSIKASSKFKLAKEEVVKEIIF